MGLKAVKIVHGISDRIDFLFLAEFFRFCGVYVGEKTIFNFDLEEELKRKCFDVYIWIPSPEYVRENIKNVAKVKEAAGSVYFHNSRKTVLAVGEEQTEIKEMSVSEQKELLRACLDEIKRLGTDVHDVIQDKLVDVYIDNHLMLHSANLQYFPKQDSIVVQDAYKELLDAYSQLEEFHNNNLNIQCNAQYAKLWCAVKVNATCQFQKKALYFPPQELAAECAKIYAKNPKFSNIKVLEGLCYEYSSDRAIDAVNAFEYALDTEDKNCNATAIYYWIGKHYEAYEAYRDRAHYHYQLAYNAMPKFRNIFKLALYEKKRGNFERTQQYFGEIIEVLLKTAEVNMLDPLELEYAFKAYQQMCHMYYTQCTDITIKYKKIIYYANEAIKAKARIDTTKFYEKLYLPERIDICKDISRQRLELNSIYRMLSDAYRDLKDFSTADRYEGMIIENKEIRQAL